MYIASRSGLNQRYAAAEGATTVTPDPGDALLAYPSDFMETEAVAFAGDGDEMSDETFVESRDDVYSAVGYDQMTNHP